MAPSFSLSRAVLLAPSEQPVFLGWPEPVGDLSCSMICYPQPLKPGAILYGWLPESVYHALLELAQLLQGWANPCMDFLSCLH